jgi:hypothetical protein
LVSVIEGIISRGDERAGELAFAAYKEGSRLDAWSEHLNKGIWRRLLSENSALVEEILRQKDPSAPLPWACVDSLTGDGYLKKELEKSNAGEITSACIEICTHNCGICGSRGEIIKNIIQPDNLLKEETAPEESGSIEIETEKTISRKDPGIFRIVFSFCKQGSAVFHSHLGLLEIFSMAFVRSGIPVLFSRGFNPLPRLDIASPLSLGIRGMGEIASLDTDGYFDAFAFMEKLNPSLPEGLRVTEAVAVFIPSGAKKHSVSALVWGFLYKNENAPDGLDRVKVKDEKAYRASRLAEGGSLYGLERISVLAGFPGSLHDGDGKSYFDIYREIYPLIDKEI